MTNPNDKAYASQQAWEDEYPNSRCASTQHVSGGGLNKREHFAAMAMQGYLSNSEWLTKMRSGTKDIPTYNIAVEYAVAAADALIRELNKETK